MLRAIWIVVLLLGTGVLAAFGSADNGSSVPKVAGQAAVAIEGDVTARDAAVQSGVGAAATIRGLTAVITAVSRRWWWPLEAGFALMQDTIHRGWSAIRRLPQPNQARP